MHQAYHLLVDLWEVPAERDYVLRFIDQTETILLEVLSLTDMRPLAEMQVVYADAEDKAWGPGTSGIQMLQDSHGALHNLLLRRAAHFDLFSCRQFDHEAVVAFLRGVFQARRGQAALIDRSPGAGFVVIWREEW